MDKRPLILLILLLAPRAQADSVISAGNVDLEAFDQMLEKSAAPSAGGQAHGDSPQGRSGISSAISSEVRKAAEEQRAQTGQSGSNTQIDRQDRRRNDTVNTTEPKIVEAPRPIETPKPVEPKRPN